ncbi:UvrD-helicase domain-containing protein [Tuanshanicoccus lijuaniae]|uniref:UvrD-helicase domain-containing protein n=1 Tax=Aerococcaceae bacterium zg-1292 TaxID=2774330 RepID=UPI001BD8D329|nr:UvrD-helicase domain-containing protein [Aerococcaceae bacterium zg-A91]MBS4458541.1 UvrD-helicase domain-containing protein [Aerococcaceae bacterium zg-BR33]
MSTLLKNIEQLNDKQREAVLTTKGPVLIAAGAGSGKTRVLTHRIAYLIEEVGVNPWNILAITFTNKAASEMRERVQQLVGEQASQIWVATFHAMCARILRREAEHIGYDRNFTIIDTGEQQTLMKQVIKEFNLDSERFNYKQLLSVIDTAKNEGKMPEEFASEAGGYIDNIHADVYRKYQSRLKAANAMDFNDLILLTVRLLQTNEAIRQFYQQKFQYIHVDEYQDTNHSQYQLVQLLSGLLRNVCVVGDADQSIYGWRGANMENILNFEQDYPDAKVILLEQNYRSTQTILKAANSVIANNTKRKDKALWSDKEAGEKVKYYQANTDRDEAQFVIENIHEIKKEFAYKNRDFAVLYRTQAQSRNLEDQFLHANIPYKIVGGLKFYSRKEIQDTLAYLRLIDNPDDNLSFNRIINVPKRGIGQATIDKLASFADELNVSWFKAIDYLTQSSISKAAQTKLVSFSHMIRQLQQQIEFLTMSELVEQVWEHTGYIDALKKVGDIESLNRIENLEEFASVTKQFDESDGLAVVESDPDFMQSNEVEDTNESSSDSIVSNAESNNSIFLLDNETTPEQVTQLTRFLTDISLVSDTVEDETMEDLVTLMTLHAAKGLEFPVVFMVGMEDGLFPLSRAMEDDDELEEERRLAYVGMTRAEKQLFLSGARSRLLYGRYQHNVPSRFINEIESKLIEKIGGTSSSYLAAQQAMMQRGLGITPKPKPPVQKAAQLAANKVALSGKRPKSVTRTGASDNKNQSWAAGDKVEHTKWGVGTVVQVSENKSDTTLSIAFPNQGIKQVIAAYAPITKL